ncbi:hypothetical protein ACER0C_023466 [Sarotherodon galilaeus]
MVLTPEGVEIDQIEHTLESVKAWLDRLTVLCETKEKVDATRIPPEVYPTGPGVPWSIIVTAEASPHEDFSQKSIICAVGDLLAKMERPSSEGSEGARGNALALGTDRDSRRIAHHCPVSYWPILRMFSGTVPTPVGEETFKQWVEQAHLMVEESDSSAKEKTRRIIESLNPLRPTIEPSPALAVVKTVRTADPDISPEQCLDAVTKAFGSAETGENLYFAFRLLQQQPQEKLSDFLM